MISDANLWKPTLSTHKSSPHNAVIVDQRLCVGNAAKGAAAGADAV
jgi:hypothetical protein